MVGERLDEMVDFSQILHRLLAPLEYDSAPIEGDCIPIGLFLLPRASLVFGAESLDADVVIEHFLSPL